MLYIVLRLWEYDTLKHGKSNLFIFFYHEDHEGTRRFLKIILLSFSVVLGALRGGIFQESAWAAKLRHPTCPDALTLHAIRSKQYE